MGLFYFTVCPHIWNFLMDKQSNDLPKALTYSDISDSLSDWCYIGVMKSNAGAKVSHKINVRICSKFILTYTVSLSSRCIMDHEVYTSQKYILHLSLQSVPRNSLRTIQVKLFLFIFLFLPSCSSTSNPFSVCGKKWTKM